MNWTGLWTQLLQVIVWTVTPIAIGFVGNLARVYANKIKNDLWRQLAIQVVTKIEAEAQGNLNGEDKLALAIEALKKQGIPAEKIHQLIEWAVAECLDKFQWMQSKLDAKKAGM